ncbi:MAG: hemolysin family protein, partial [Candidatus Hodarchaeota archaeon]
PDTQVRMIMTPRPDMVTVTITDDFHSLIETVTNSGHSRFPVFDENRENIIGFLYAKDLLNYMGLVDKPDSDLHDARFNISELLREADYVPETMRADLILEDFQNNKRHSAVVVDEFGEVVGLITLEDILELLVGDIQDEYDFEPIEIIPTNASNGELRVSGQTSLDDFNTYFKTNLTSDISVTIGGFVLEKLGRPPKEKEVIKFKDLIFAVEEVAGSRIMSLLVHVKGVDLEQSSKLSTEGSTSPTSEPKD